MSVARLEREIKYPELVEWMAYDCIEPIAIGPRANLLAAQIEAALWNVRRTKTSQKYFTVKDCVLDFDLYRVDQDPKVKTGQALAKTAMALMASQKQRKERGKVITTDEAITRA